jgi:Protein of unknown function (DUF1302)
MLRSLTAFALSAGTLAFGARAADLYSADGLDIRWDNILRYSAGIRTDAANPVLLASANSNEGDSNFAQGLMSNRLDLLSILDITKDDVGFQASVEAWYDTVYHSRTANNTSFPRATRSLDGEYIDLADTFFFANSSVGDTPVTIRIGRQTLLWGESLFFDDNSIAAAQAPVDYVKSIATAAPYSNDVYLPVDQVSFVAQPRSNVSLAAYYQFVWRGSRLPGVGSYFSTTDYLGAGAEYLFPGMGRYLVHTRDQKPNDGQFGAALHVTEGDIDYGFYLLRYDAKYPVLEVEPNAGAASGAGYAGEFRSLYPSKIWLYGASFSTYVGDVSVAGEFAARRGAALFGYSAPSVYQSLIQSGRTFSEYAEGNTLYAQISGAKTFSPTAMWDSADLSAEVTSNYIVKVTENQAMLDLGKEEIAANLRVLFEPHYFEVLPDFDLSLPFGLGYDIHGRYGYAYTVGQGGGDFEAGVSAHYASVWTTSLTVTRFFGSPSRQPLTDRSFVLFSVQRTF